MGAPAGGVHRTSRRAAELPHMEMARTVGDGVNRCYHLATENPLSITLSGLLAYAVGGNGTILYRCDGGLH